MAQGSTVYVRGLGALRCKIHELYKSYNLHYLSLSLPILICIYSSISMSLSLYIYACMHACMHIYTLDIPGPRR